MVNPKLLAQQEKELAHFLIEEAKNKQNSDQSHLQKKHHKTFSQVAAGFSEDDRLKGIATNVKHGLYVQAFFPCSACRIQDCPQKGNFVADVARCELEKQYFITRYMQVSESFDLDEIDKDALVRILFTILKLKRIDVQLAKTLYSKHLVFNPKTGAEHEHQTSNILFPIAQKLEKELREWLDNSKLSRRMKDPVEAKNSITMIFQQFVKQEKEIKEAGSQDLSG